MIRKIKEKILASESQGVIKGMLTLLLGAGLSRIVGLISIPILSRIFTPENFGLLALYTSFVIILAPIFTLRYVQAIPLPKNDLIAFGLFKLCVRLIVIGLIFISIILFLFGDYIFDFFNVDELSSNWWVVVFGAGLMAVYELLTLWATRRRQYTIIAKTQFYQSTFGEISKIGFGVLLLQSYGLIVGQLFGYCVAIIAYIKEYYNDFNRLIPKARFNKEYFLLRYYQDYVWYRLPAQLLMVLSLQAPVLLVANLYSNEITGQLSMALLLLSLPVTLFSQSISKAFYGEIASIGKRNFKKIKRITIDIQKKLFLIGFPASLLIYFMSEWLFEIFLGSEWKLAGVFAALLAPYVLFQFTSSPLMEVINLLGEQFYFLIINLSRLIGFGIIFSYFGEVSAIDFVRILSIYLSAFYLIVSVFILYALSEAEVKG